MFASSSSLRDNIKYGNTYDFGNFDECLNTIHSITSDDVITGQHCLYQYFSLGKPQLVRIGPEKSVFNMEWNELNARLGGAICIPASCPPETVEHLVTKLFNGTEFEIAKDYNQKNYCKTLKSNERTPTSSVILFGIVALLIILTLFGTIYDARTENIEKMLHSRWLMAFSLKSNWSNLHKDDLRQAPGAMNYLRGIRAFSLFIITVTHSFTIRTMFPFHHPEEDEMYKKHYVLATVTILFVDAFFVISGLLASRKILQLLKL